MARRLVLVYAALLALSAGGAAAAIFLGHGDLGDPGLRPVLLELRSTRVAAAFLAGAAEAVGGAAVQGFFRNPLVSPSILGTTAGAMLGGQAALLGFAALPALGALPGLLAHVGPVMLLPIGCLAGALAALALLLAFGRAHHDQLALLLTGFILSSLFLAIGGLATSLSQDSWDLARAVVSFTLGGVGGVGPRHLLVALPLVAAGAAALWAWGRHLDLLLSGEEEAATLGVDVRRVRRWLVVWVAAITAAAVSVGGGVAFVGLVVPHAVRPFVGADHRRLLPAAALAGGVFLLACDLLVRALPTRAEVPLGVVTGIIGAPLFLVLLARARRRVEHG
jgi:iron complex transport system permease protein